MRLIAADYTRLDIKVANEHWKREKFNWGGSDGCHMKLLHLKVQLGKRMDNTFEISQRKGRVTIYVAKGEAEKAVREILREFS